MGQATNLFYNPRKPKEVWIPDRGTEELGKTLFVMV